MEEPFQKALQVELMFTFVVSWVLRSQLLLGSQPRAISWSLLTS
jgi:hypothetical protein